ncbi:MAG: hypothetical protein M3P06_11360 [Acidobacteriota bacterium]|nr:hypothetical protein [Acidobacteriota bacterium]
MRNTRAEEFRGHFTKMLRDLADRVDSGEVTPHTMNMGAPIAQFAPPGAVTYDNVHTGEFHVTLELVWEEKQKVDAYWEKVNQYDGLLPARVI